MLSANPARGLSLAEISRRLDVHKASCHSMLAVLLARGWLVRDPHTKAYRMGPALMRLGAAVVSRFPALDLARPAMEALTALTGAHCIAFLVEGGHVTVAHQVRNQRVASTPMADGTELPGRPPYGATLAAWSSESEQEAWLGQAPTDTRDRYRKVLDGIRRRGYTVGLHVLPDVRLQELAALIRAAETRSTRLGELAEALTDELMHREEWYPATLSPRRLYDVSHVDAPVFDHDGAATLVLSLVPVPAATTGAGVAALGEQLLAVTAELSRALGARIQPPG